MNQKEELNNNDKKKKRYKSKWNIWKLKDKKTSKKDSDKVY